MRNIGKAGSGDGKDKGGENKDRQTDWQIFQTKARRNGALKKAADLFQPQFAS